MRYLSVCSGIEAATVAWHPLGWTPAAFAEIERFPSAVLAHHYPHVRNLGDMTRFQEWDLAAFDVLIGGTPCQSFSVAGLRKGLADPRGNLALTFLAIADRYRPRWVVWENVTGVLSSTSHDAPDPCPPSPPLGMGRCEVDTEDEYESDELHAFYSLVAGFSELGYFGAYGTLDAQYFRLAQRRRRVFAVFHFGDWRRAAAVLFERESLSGHPAPCREAGQEPAPCLGAGPVSGGRTYGTDADSVRSLICADVAPTLNAHFGKKQGLEDQHINGGAGLFIAHSLRADGFDASEDGTGRGTPLVCFDERQVTSQANRSQCHGDVAATMHEKPLTIAFKTDQDPESHGDICPTLQVPSRSGGGQQHCVAFANTAGDTALGMSLPDAPPITTRNGDPGNVLLGMQVRRLTPRECERLQGFPDDYTLIQYRGKFAADGPRYKALGNSMAVPVMAWIGRRIQIVDAIAGEGAA